MWKTVNLLLLCAVSLPQSIAQSRADDDYKWSWGVVDEQPVTVNASGRLNEETGTSTTESSSYNPCADYNPPTPSFKSPGRRLNEEKCEEYIYDVKLQEEKSNRALECQYLTEKGEPNSFSPQAVGGRNAKPSEFLHMGAIGWKGVTEEYVFKCGSTLISPKFVVTAAHCIRAPVDSVIDDPDPKIVRLNDGNLFNNPGGFPISISPDKKISRIIVHPQYQPPKKYFDIALMELDTEVTFSQKVRPACLWNRPDTGDFGTEASLTGWGVLAQGSLNISPNLQAADVDIIDSSQCDELLKNSRNRHWQGVTDNQLCAGRLEGGVDACQGDSGGPLQFRRPLRSSSHGNIYYMIGVTSFGIGCALPNHPGIYTRVSSFVDWIEEHVWK